MARVKKETIIGEILQMDPYMAHILMGAGMHCVGCPSSAGESLGEACMVHGMEVDDVLEELNTFLDSQA